MPEDLFTADLFADDRRQIALSDGAWLLGGFALPRADALIAAIAPLIAAAPFRHWETPGGRHMSVAMSNCGPLGWVSDRGGYRYTPRDPLSGAKWPPMPPLFLGLAQDAAAKAGYPDFQPDACLINRYQPGTQLTLHQDQDEQDLRAPIVSVSLGLPALFLWGGDTRAQRPARHRLSHGDVVVWGGRSRMVFHGVAPLPDGQHPATGSLRYNLTFRKAGAGD